MKKNRGIAVVLFAILFQMCSTGLELVSLLIGIIGLVLTFRDNKED